MDLKLIFIDVYPSSNYRQSFNDIVNDICDKKEVMIEIDKASNQYSLRHLLSDQSEITIKNKKYITLRLLRDGTCFASTKMLIQNETKWVTFSSHQATNDTKKHSNMTFIMGLIDCIKIKIKYIYASCLLESIDKKQTISTSIGNVTPLVKINNNVTLIQSQFTKTLMTKAYKTNIPIKHKRSKRNNNNITHVKTCNNVMNINSKKNQSYEMPANSFISYGNIDDNTNPNSSLIHPINHNTNSTSNSNNKTNTNGKSNNQHYQTMTDSSSKKQSNIRKCLNPISSTSNPKESSNSSYNNNTKIVNKSNGHHKLIKLNYLQSTKTSSLNKSHVIESKVNSIGIGNKNQLNLNNNNESILSSDNIDQSVQTEVNVKELSLITDSNIIKDVLLEKEREEQTKVNERSNNQIKSMMIIEDPPQQFEELKNDFELFYTEEYLKNIHNEVLVFELELAVDKVFEMFEAYHNEINHLKNNHNLFKEYFILFSEKFLKISKELLRLKLEREKSNIDNALNNFDNSSHKKQCGEMVLINKKEIDIISMIYNCKIEKTLLSDFNKSQKEKKTLTQGVIKNIALNHSYKSLLSLEQTKLLDFLYANVKANEKKEIERIRLEKEKEKEIEENALKNKTITFSKHSSTGSHNDKEETKPSSSIKEKTTQNLIQHKKPRPLINNNNPSTNSTHQNNKLSLSKNGKPK